VRWGPQGSPHLSHGDGSDWPLNGRERTASCASLANATPQPITNFFDTLASFANTNESANGALLCF